MKATGKYQLRSSVVQGDQFVCVYIEYTSFPFKDWDFVGLDWTEEGAMKVLLKWIKNKQASTVIKEGTLEELKGLKF